MYEYQKGILEKVSFNKELFLLELQKSKRFMSEDEYFSLLNWAYHRYGQFIDNIPYDRISEDKLA